jgi:stage II sporulation protein M
MRIFTPYQRRVDDFLADHRGAVMLLSALFVLGVIIGALAVRTMDLKERADLTGYLGATLGTLQKAPVGSGMTIFTHSLLVDLKVLAILWVLGISIVGALGVMVLAIACGYVSGLLVAFLAVDMGLRGVLVAAAGHLPPNLIKVPALLVAGSASLGFSLQVVRAWRAGRRVPHFYRTLAHFTWTLAGAGAILVVAGLMEGYLAPSLVRAVGSLFRGS